MCGDIERILDVSHLTDEEVTRFYLYTPFQEIIFILLFSMVTAFGLFGNVSFLIAVLCYKQMRTLTNVYLVNLAVADLIFIINNEAAHEFLSYISSHGVNIGIIFKTEEAYLAKSIINYVTYMTSIVTIVLVSFERFMGVCHPLRYRVVRSTKQTLILVALSWLFALTFALINVFTWNVFISKLCVVWPLRDKYKSLPNVFHVIQSFTLKFFSSRAGTVLFITALILNTYFYTRIIQRLWRRTATRDDQRRRYIRTQRRVLRMLVVNAIVFFFCLAPEMILDSIDESYPGNFKSTTWASVFTFSALTTLFNSAANPYIYNATNEEYRKILYQMFTECWKRCKLVRQRDNTTSGDRQRHEEIEMTAQNRTNRS